MLPCIVQFIQVFARSVCVFRADEVSVPVVRHACRAAISVATALNSYLWLGPITRVPRLIRRCTFCSPS